MDEALDKAVDKAGLLELARDTAAEAAALAATMRARGVDVTATKSSPTDVVTAADQACEQLIRQRLLDARPGDAFFGEEGGGQEVDAGGSGVRWIVDPIDGTVNYMYGLPAYCVSIAASVDGEVQVGVVHAPALDLAYAATRGGGATCNGVPLPQRGSHPPSPPLAESLVATGLSYDRNLRAQQAAALARMAPQVRDIRRIGSAALDLCSVASGQCDAYVEEGLNVWDRAAGGLVATETGARLELWPTSRGKDLVLCAPVPVWTGFSDLVKACGFLDGDAP